jgi:hypothetical protein
MTPYSNVSPEADPYGMHNGFNYYESSDRIWIEYSFGELIIRWGIFWRTLLFDLLMCGIIILVAMLLHNFIINERTLLMTTSLRDSTLMSMMKSNSRQARQKQENTQAPWYRTTMNQGHQDIRSGTLIRNKS